MDWLQSLHSNIHSFLNLLFSLSPDGHEFRSSFIIINFLFSVVNFTIISSIIISIIRFRRRMMQRESDKIQRIEEFKRMDFEKLSAVLQQLNRIEDYLKMNRSADE
jgi:hypothetical protein